MAEGVFFSSWGGSCPSFSVSTVHTILRGKVVARDILWPGPALFISRQPKLRDGMDDRSVGYNELWDTGGGRSNSEH